MHAFTYRRATSPAAAVVAHQHDATLAFIAGGTDLLGLMKDRATLPAHLLDINSLPGLDRIEELPDGALRIGALVRMSDAAADQRVRDRFPAVAQGLLFAASGQLRNMASMGGNLLQRTRCPYFRDGDGVACNKRDPGSGCSSRHGVNRNQAIFGWSNECVAVHPSDVAVALVAMGATIEVLGPLGAVSIPLADFHTLPGRTPQIDNVLGRGDLITAIVIPKSPEAKQSHYLKVRDRQSYEFALVSVAAGIVLDGRRIRSVRLAMGGVAPKPWRLAEAETALRGVGIDDEHDLKAAIAKAFIDARPLSDNGFKIELSKRAVLRALQTAGALT